MIEAIVLGAGAGGGFPQWNSNTVACRRARAGDPAALSCTQASIAVSGNGTGWLVLNASPDLRIQIERTPALHPRDGLRSTPIAGVVLTGGEVDCIAGLLTLREGQRFQLLATAPVLARLDQNPIFEVMSRTLVPRVALPLEASMLLSDTALSVTAFAVPGKVPLYAEAGSPGEPPPPSDDDTIGLEISDGTRRLLFIPGCAAMTPALRARLDGADCVFFDGTLWRDNEMITAGLGPKTGARMGHMSVAGPGGVLDGFEGLRIGRRILIHMNNSNPVLLRDSVERADAEQAGWDVAQDGMTVRL